MNSGAASSRATASGTTESASTSTTRDDATIAAIRAFFADIRIQRSLADTATGGNTELTIGATAIGTTRSATATIGTATMDIRASYGSRDAYKNNYRAGFRQGYEEGYRNGARYRR